MFRALKCQDAVRASSRCFSRAGQKLQGGSKGAQHWERIAAQMLMGFVGGRL